MTHTFQESLEQSHAASDYPFWLECYQNVFPTMVGFHDHRGDGQHQRNGIDRSVVLENGKTIWIDEKVRGKNKITGIVYRDIALEEFSDRHRKTPGWVKKPLLADYIAYAIAPHGVCYLLPVIQLQTAWLQNETRWKLEYPKQIIAKNRNRGVYWETLSWGIPPEVVLGHILCCLRASFTPVELTE